MRILVVEDEEKTNRYLKKGLSENGFVVEQSWDGEAGLRAAKASAFDLIVLDIMLPKLDGWTVLSEIRRSGLKTPVLFLSAKDMVQDRVKGLELGADDYLVKPFAFTELLARIRSVLRRGPQKYSDVLRIADLEVDLVHHKVTRAGGRIDLTAKEFLLLSLLMRRSGEVLSRTVIAEMVWDMHYDSDTNVVEVHVRRLRAKIDDPYAVKLIHTVRRSGYVLELRQ